MQHISCRGTQIAISVTLFYLVAKYTPGLLTCASTHVVFNAGAPSHFCVATCQPLSALCLLNLLGEIFPLLNKSSQTFLVLVCIVGSECCLAYALTLALYNSVERADLCHAGNGHTL